MCHVHVCVCQYAIESPSFYCILSSSFYLFTKKKKGKETVTIVDDTKVASIYISRLVKNRICFFSFFSLCRMHIHTMSARGSSDKKNNNKWLTVWDKSRFGREFNICFVCIHSKCRHCRHTRVINAENVPLVVEFCRVVSGRLAREKHVQLCVVCTLHVMYMSTKLLLVVAE